MFRYYVINHNRNSDKNSEEPFLDLAQDLSPLILLANCISFGMMVTLLAWMAHKLVSSKRPTKYDSEASWSARTAEDWNLKSFLNSEAISLTSL